jgi:transcriptional regulator with XRE-family HTH domain
MHVCTTGTIRDYSNGVTALTVASLRRRRLARALTQLRERAGLGVTEAARQVGFSQAKLSRIESAQIAISGDDTYALCGTLGVPTDATDELVQLARQAKRRDWWQAYPDTVLGRTTDLLELEADASSKHSFTIDVVPGLLQTEAYARAVIRNGMPRESDESIQQRVDMRMTRQQRITSGELECWAIIDEPALRRAVGGPAVMAEQVAHLAEVAQGPHVSIQVLPLSLTGHLALGTPFNTFTLDDGCSYVALDNLTGGLYIEDEAEVRAYADTWSKLAAVALSFEHSAELLRTIAGEHRSNAREPRPRPLRMAEEQGKQ